MARTAEIINARTGLTLSQASIHGFVSKAAVELKPMIAKIANLCRQDQVLHLDETGMTVNGKTHWAMSQQLHRLPTCQLTASGAWGILAACVVTDEVNSSASLRPVLVHDGFSPYKSLPYVHALCYVEEQMEQSWAGKMRDLLLQVYLTLAGLLSCA